MQNDITNQKFNNLIAKNPIFQYRREWVWLCLCDCGKETNVRISKLNNGTTKSCGCLKNKNLTYSKEAGNLHGNWKGFKNLSKSFYSRIQNSAIKRNIEFDISIEYLFMLFEKQNGKCSYTGKDILLPTNVRQLRGENNEDIASLDRKDNSKGYIIDNLQWVCKRVNYMKHTMKDEYFLNWIKEIYEYKNLKR